MKILRYIVAAAMVVMSVEAWGQVDRHEVRAGNRDFKKDKWQQADIDYRKALVKDSLSFAGNYNLANTQYRQQDMDGAKASLDKIKDVAPASKYAADYWYNVGDVAIAKKDWSGAVDALKKSLLLRPDDLDAKENYIYAKKMLDNQKGGGGGGQNNQNQDQQNQDNNGQGNQDQNQNNQNNQDNQNNNQNQDQQNQQGQNGQGDQQPQEGQASPQNVKISPQQAQQMLKAIQAKEKDTQDKVNKEKAEALKSKQKEKNW